MNIKPIEMASASRPSNAQFHKNDDGSTNIRMTNYKNKGIILEELQE